MSSKVKTQPGTKQLKLELQSVKKKLFKKKYTTVKNVSQIRDEAIVKKKGEFARVFVFHGHYYYRV